MNLENKIPPYVVAAICAFLMKGLTYLPPVLVFPRLVVVAILLVLIGTAMGIAGLWAFRQAQTTIDPLKPEKTSHFVSNGVYRYTRNPMYVGVACFLAAWAVWLAHLLSWVGVLLFIAYITRFQIVPEERVLKQKFGAEYDSYQQKVRRWL